MLIYLENGAMASEDTHVIKLGGHGISLYAYYENKMGLKLRIDSQPYLSSEAFYQSMSFKLINFHYHLTSISRDKDQVQVPPSPTSQTR